MVKRGFSLVELLIAVALIVTALIPLLQALGSTLIASTSSVTEATALNLAGNKMEELKSLTFAALTAEAKSSLPNQPNLQRSVSVDSPAVNLKRVAVTVSWATAASSESAVTLETYVANF